MLKGNKSEFKKKDLVLPVFFASVIVLLFSMLIPLKWFPEEFVYKLKVFNQFRSVGRFSWVFYYVTGITVIVLLDRFSRTNSAWKRISATCLIVLFPLMNMAESWEAYKFFCTQNGKSPNLFLEKNLSTKKDWNQVLEKIRQEKDAVILPLPFFHIGSEHAMRGGTTEIQQLTMVMSYHSGLPTVGSFLSRTSVTETISIFKMLAPEKNEGGLPKGIDGKDLLILTTQQPLDQYEEQILKASEPMYIGESIGLYRLKFKDYQKQAQKQLSMRMKNSLVIDPAFIKNKGESDSSILILNDFEGLKSEHVFAGSGALKVQKKVYSFLATVPSRGIDTLTASFWYYKGKSGLYNAMVIVEEIDTVTNAGQWKLVTDANRSPIFRDDWVLVEVPIMMREGNFKYNLLIVGPPESKEHFYIDNLMVRKSSNDYLIKLPEWCPSAYQTYFNNLPFHR
jgi:hypothetical protein